MNSPKPRTRRAPSTNLRALSQRLAVLKRETNPNIRTYTNYAVPRSVHAPDKCWHSRNISYVVTADSTGKADLTLGQLASAISASAGNVPFRVNGIKVWSMGIINASSAANTQIDASLFSAELVNNTSDTSTVRALGYGRGTVPASVGFDIPRTLSIVRAVGLTNTSTWMTVQAGVGQSQIVVQVSLEFCF